MADRKSFPFRFWTSTRRRTAPRPPASPPPSVSTRAPSSKTEAPTNSRPIIVDTSPPSVDTASFTTPATSEPENQDPVPSTITEPTAPPSREVPTATAIQSTNDAAPASLVDEPQTSSLSRSTSQSKALSQPASPAHRPSQSRSPPQPLSPSHVSPKTRSSPPSEASPTPSTPRKKPLPRSPAPSTKLASSPSIKRVKPASPSKESKRSTPKSSVSSFVPNEEEPKPAVSQHEPTQLQQPADIQKDNFHDSSGLETKHRNSSQKIQNLDNSNPNDELERISESSASPEETMEVKVAVEQVTKTENMEEIEKETNGFLTPQPDLELHTTKNLNTGSDSGTMHDEKQEIKQSTPLENYKQSAQPRGENVPLHQEIREDLSTFVNKIAIGDLKNGVRDKPVCVITLAGENRGASMHLGSDSSWTEGPVHIHRRYKIDHSESYDITKDSESLSKHAKKMESPRSLEDQPAEAYVNNNAQSINNSLVFNCSISERDPGVHMVLANVPKESLETREKTMAPNIQKAEFSTTTAERVMYKPRIRRSCLKGLFFGEA